MYPVVKSGNKCTWKVENIEELDHKERFSDVFATDDLKWKIGVRAVTFVEPEEFQARLYIANEFSNNESWLIEVHKKFRLVNPNTFESICSCNSICTCPPLLYTPNNTFSSFYYSISLPAALPYIHESSTIVEWEFDFKYYNFSKTSSNLSLCTIQNVEFYLDVGYFRVFSDVFSEIVDNNNEARCLDDVNPEDFVKVLAALCADPISITSNSYGILMEMSEKLNIPILTKKCENQFKNIICPQHVEGVKRAVRDNDMEFVETIVSEITRQYEFLAFVEHESFEELQNRIQLFFWKSARKFLPKAIL